MSKRKTNKNIILFSLKLLYEQAQKYIDISDEPCKRTQHYWNEQDYEAIKNAIEEMMIEEINNEE